jgi:NADH dehydrogenase/NADH:ubiquinone oxidoreductase subunit G
MSIITTEILERALPDKFKKSLNQELLDNINNTLSDPDLQETLRENFLSYIDVLNDGRYKITDYLNAIKYTTQKLMGNSNIDAYVKTFPARYQDQLQRGLSNKDIQSIITVYNKSKLVNAIMEQSLVPSWILNQHLHQQAINVQAELMNSAQSEKVRSDAANSLLIHLKPPEVTKVELDIGIKDNDQLSQLREVTVSLAAQQKRLIEAGVMTAKNAAEQRVIQGVTYDQ